MPWKGLSSVSFAAIRPATIVPWEAMSQRAPSLSPTMSTAVTCPSSRGWWPTPESITATLTPAPLVSGQIRSGCSLFSGQGTADICPERDSALHFAAAWAGVPGPPRTVVAATITPAAQTPRRRRGERAMRPHSTQAERAGEGTRPHRPVGAGALTGRFAQVTVRGWIRSLEPLVVFPRGDTVVVPGDDLGEVATGLVGRVPVAGVPAVGGREDP